MDMSIKEIVSKMTLEEKALLITGGGPMNTAPFPNLNVPAKNLSDGPHGVRSADPEANCVCFPSMCSLGAGWNPEAAEQNGRALAEDCIRHNIQMILAPGINIKRNPLCGRNFEYVSEDPVLAGKIGAGFIRGAEKRGVATSLKHFAVNSQETNRTKISAEPDERTLRELYLKGFEIAVKEGKPQSVMCAYNKISSVWCSENKMLLDTILRKEWGFKGFTVSDWGAVHSESRALMAGLDLQMPKNARITEKIQAALDAGEITGKALDQAVERILRFSMRKFPKESRVSRKSLHKAAQKLASEGICLLKNDGNLLPLTTDKVKRIAVIGELAKTPMINGQGSGEVFPKPEFVDSPLECLQKNLPGVEIDCLETQTLGFPEKMSWPTYWRLFANLKDYDAVVVFLGFQKSMDSEKYDRQTNRLSPYLELLLDEVTARSKKTVLVLQTGSCVFPADWAKYTPAIVEMWLAGEGGGQAIADVLTGKINPSGKLPETFPKNVRKDMDLFGDNLQLEYRERLDVGYRYYDKHPEEVWFPFGHGLSYTSFAYSEGSAVADKDGVTLSFFLENVGSADGAEVAQIYLRDPISTVSKPQKELKAFRKIILKAGEKTAVTVRLSLHDLSYYNTSLHQWIAEPGKYELLVASSSADIRLNVPFLLDIPCPYSMVKLQDDMIG